MEVQSLPIPRAAKIVSHPDILGGAAVVAGTRVPVWAIAYHGGLDGDIDGVLEAHPHLTRDDVLVAMAYYEQHRDDIERYVAEHLEPE